MVQSTYMYMKTLAYNFDTNITRMKTMLSAMNTELVKYQDRINNQFKQGNNRIAQHAGTKMREIAQVANEQAQKYAEDLDDKFSKYIELYQSKLKSLAEQGKEKLQTKYTELEGNLERKMQQAIESATTGIKNITQKLIPPQEKLAILHAEKDATSFPRDTIDFKMLTSQPTKRHQTDAIHMRSANLIYDEKWSRYGPPSTYPDHDQQPLIPALLPYKLVTNVRVPYMGKESSCTWYYTFRSAVQQYRVLLIPVDQFKKDKSLCPRNYYGTKVDPLRYKDMADALYQLLQLPDTIPMEHTEAQNIINRHASNTDSYSACYKIME
jgi:hypothetical protein